MNSMDKYQMKKDIQWLVGRALMIVGMVMVIASVSPLPCAPILASIIIAITGFGAIFNGNRLQVKAGGEPFFDGQCWPPKL